LAAPPPLARLTVPPRQHLAAAVVSGRQRPPAVEPPCPSPTEAYCNSSASW
jgi:hypothetical protein